MPTLVYRDADGIDRTHVVGTEPVVIGRAVECQVQSQDPRVSRRHARVLADAGAWFIEDLGSSNGVFVDGTKVTRAEIPPATLLLVGSLMIWMFPDAAAESP